MEVMQALMSDATKFLLRAVILIVIGVILANIMMESGVIERLTPLFLPFCHASRLPKECVISLLTCFFNPTAGKAMLAGFYQSRKVSEREALLTSVMSTFPIVAGESLFRVQAPLAVVLLGPFIGTAYILLNLFSALIQSGVAFLLARMLHEPSAAQPHAQNTQQKGKAVEGRGAVVVQVQEAQRRLSVSEGGVEAVALERSASGTANVNEENEGKEAETVKERKASERKEERMERLKTALIKSVKTLKKVIPTLVIAFLIIDFLLISGGMEVISGIFEPVLHIFGLPGECITAIMADLIHFSAGYATVSALLQSEVINAKQAILTLLVGSILTITMIYMKHSFSMYVSLFGKLGVKISIVNYSFSVIAKLFIIVMVMFCM